MYEAFLREGRDAEQNAELDEELEAASAEEHVLSPEEMRDLALAWGGEVSA